MSRLVFCVVILFTLSAGGCLASSGKFVLCSEFNGRLVTADGAPAVGVKVVRNWTWGWNDKTGSDDAVTDAQGRFSFPEVRGSSWSAGLLPHTASIEQQVIAHSPEGEVLLYEVDKAGYEADDELRDRGLRGPGINLVCRIDQEPGGGGPFWGTCQPDG